MLPEVSERLACRVLGQPRAVQRYTARVRDDEGPLTGRIVELASMYGRYGLPRITGMLRNEGWTPAWSDSLGAVSLYRLPG